MHNMYFYGQVLYSTMVRMKCSCRSDNITSKERDKILTYTRLWDKCLLLFYDELNNNTDNTGLLKRYIAREKRIDFSAGVDEYSVEGYVTVPYEAMGLMAKLIAETETELLAPKVNCEKIWFCIHALHNLPRCMLSPQHEMFIRQSAAVKYSEGDLERIEFSEEQVSLNKGYPSKYGKGQINKTSKWVI